MLKIVDFLSRYKYIFIGLVIGLILSYAGYSGFQYWSNQQNQKEADMIFQYRTRLVQAEKEHGGSVLESSQLEVADKVEDYSLIRDVVDSYVNFLKQRDPVRSVHLASAIELSYFLVHYDQDETALQLLDTLSSTNVKNNWLYYVFIIRLGSLFMDSQNYTRAIHLFSSIVNQREAEAFHLEAWLKMGLCYEALNEHQQAAEIYSTIQKKELAHLYKEKSIHYDRLLKVKQKLNQK